MNIYLKKIIRFIFYFFYGWSILIPITIILYSLVKYGLNNRTLSAVFSFLLILIIRQLAMRANSHGNLKQEVTWEFVALFFVVLLIFIVWTQVAGYMFSFLGL